MVPCNRPVALIAVTMRTTVDSLWASRELPHKCGKKATVRLIFMMFFFTCYISHFCRVLAAFISSCLSNLQ